MPDDTEHTQLALHGIDVAHHLLKTPEFRDWVAIALFYSALHIVEAVFFSDQADDRTKHGQNHDGREAVLKGATSYHKIWEHYRELLSASIIARYLQDRSGRTILFNVYMSETKVREVLVKHHFWQLIKSASKFLTSQSADSLKRRFNSYFAAPEPQIKADKDK